MTSTMANFRSHPTKEPMRTLQILMNIISSCEISYLFGNLFSDQARIFSWFAQIYSNASKIVPYLGFLSDSSREVFHLIPEKKEKFLDLIEQTLACSIVSVKSLQRLVGKCVSFLLVVTGALLFTREMNNAISKALRTSRPIKLHEALREEISHWLSLRTWDDPLPCRDERHIRISLATDASASGWGGSITLSDRMVEASDYWTKEEQELDISTKEALALDKVLLSFSDSLKNAWVDGLVDNQSVVYSWQRQGGRSMSLNRAIKKFFFHNFKVKYCPPSDVYHIKRK